MKVINLTKGFTAIVDDCDYEIVSKFKWRALVCQHTIYAYGRIKINKEIIPILMHRFILGLGNDDVFEVDHINGNGLDNRRLNLRPCTSQQNKRNMKRRSDNTSGFKGVTWNIERKRWISQIGINGTTKRIGRFKNKIEAANAYDKKAKEIFGEFARPNFQEDK